MNADLASKAIEQLPEAIAQEFREFDARCWKPHFSFLLRPALRRYVEDTRDQLAKALDLYRHIFTEWTDFYTTISSHLSKGWVQSEDGRPTQSLNFKDAATRAIEGMPDSDIVTHTSQYSAAVRRLKDLDLRFAGMCKPPETADVHEQAQRIILALETAREMVKELALTCAKLHSDLAAARVQADQYVEYRRIVGEPQKLQSFLQGECPKTWASLSDGRPLVEIAEEIVRRLTNAQVVG